MQHQRMEEMKVLILADINSPHTLKWITTLREKNIEVEVFSLANPKEPLKEYMQGIPVYSESFSDNYFNRDETYLKKLLYIKSLFRLRKLVKKIKPDILHAHYASSYGLLGALVNFHPFVVSVWGSDVFDFPRKSAIHKLIMKYVFRKADKILSTSNIMAKETNLYTQKEIAVTPFGVDTEKFQPGITNNVFLGKSIVIGTVKALEKKYGMKYLLKSFSIIKLKHPELIIELLIVGGGTEEKQLKELAKQLGIESDTTFTGKISPTEVNKYHSQLSIAVFPSIYDSESFGVAVLEASACQVPVIASRIGGLTEVVQDGITGILVPPRDEVALAEAIEKLVLDKSLRKRMGQAGRIFVKQKYELIACVNLMVKVYKDVTGIQQT